MNVGKREAGGQFSVSVCSLTKDIKAGERGNRNRMGEGCEGADGRQEGEVTGEISDSGDPSQ